MESAATKNYVLLFLLAVLILSVFLQTAKHEFIHFDVSEYLTQNNIVQRGLTREGLVWAFTTLKTGDWQPLTWISWMLDVHFFGVNARASHLINVLFHLLNALFFFALIQKMTGKTGRSFFAAALYAMHPLRADSVVWVAERKDVLSTFFLFLTCFQYLHYSRSVGRRFLSYGLILIWFALGLMAKPMLVTLPFALLLFDYWPLAQLKTKADFISKVVEKIPMLLLSLGSCWMTLRAAVYSGVLADPEVLPWSVRLCNAFVSYLQYLVKLFYPVGLSYFYPYRGYDL